MNKLLTIISVSLLTLLYACDIKESNITPDSSFIRVYESLNTNEKYYPEDVVQLENGGYMVLSAFTDTAQSQYPLISLTALNPKGEVLATEVLPGSYFSPAGEWLQVGGNYYFACIREVSFETVLFQVSFNGTDFSVTEAENFDATYPLAAWSNGDQVVILNFNLLGTYCEINLYDNNFNQVNRQGLGNMTEDAADVIFDHVSYKNGKRQPFFIGPVYESAEGPVSGFFANGLTNHSLALVFFDVAGSQQGKVNSFQIENSLNAVMSLGGDTFAVARRHSGDEYVAPKIGLDIGGLQNAEGFDDIHISQFKANAPTDIILFEKDGEEYIVFASTNKNNTIVLLFFLQETGEYVYTHSLGYGNPVEVMNVISTTDGGLAVFGTTEINQSFRRIILFKLSPDQLDIED